eukprot:750480-Hanusia_phi.AAC.10
MASFQIHSWISKAGCTRLGSHHALKIVSQCRIRREILCEKTRKKCTQQDVVEDGRSGGGDLKQ